MLSPNLLSDDQNRLIDRMYEHDITLAVAETGFGKSVCALTAIQDMIKDGVVKKVLVVAPLKPCNSVWAVEHTKWEHLTGLRVNKATDDDKSRRAIIATECDVCVINFENLVWFFNTYGADHGFDGIVIDEMTKLKACSKGVKKLRHAIRDFKWRVGLTATPVAENFTGLFYQTLCLDGGERFGRNKQLFLQKYFFAVDYNQYNWQLREGQEKPLLNCIYDLLYVADGYKSDLPPLVEKELVFNLPAGTMAEYNQFKRNSIFKIDKYTVIADNAAVLSSKLEQFASGFLYSGGKPKDRKTYPIHSYRIWALEEYLDLPENKDKNILIFFKFTAERDALLEYLGSEAVLIKDEQTEADWNAGKIKYLLCHPKSASHGLNLEAGGCRILWYSPEWSNDAFTQANERLWRRNQEFEVIATTLVATGTVNELTVARIEDKREVERLFKQHMSGG